MVMISALYKLALCIVMVMSIWNVFTVVNGSLISNAFIIIVGIVCFIELLQRLIITILVESGKSL